VDDSGGRHSVRGRRDNNRRDVWSEWRPGARSTSGMSAAVLGNLAGGPGCFQGRVRLFLRAAPVKLFLIIPRIF
jgi:hypothetical protein